MKIIITAGGTTEKIDPVREITNTGTGRLGALTAEEFVRQAGGRVEKIYYVCGRGATVPKLGCLEAIAVGGAQEAGDALSRLLRTEKITAAVHSMAVSDYTAASLTTAESLAAFLAGRLSALPDRAFADKRALAAFLADCIRENDRLLERSAKVRSDYPDLILNLKQTPKLIGLFKSLQPSTVLVGFKLLNRVEKARLLEAAFSVLTKNSCDFVLANDLAEISGERHVGYLISPDKTCVRLETKAEIAREIVRSVLLRVEKEDRP
mgnify:CR=1 FL=1